MQKQKPPIISVVIPAYNEAHFIADCLQSLAEQVSAPEHEIIVVDNNSTDSTAKVARSFGAHVVEAKNRGVCFARQAGYEAAKGEIIVSTDADTTFAPDWLAKIAAGFEQGNSIVAVAGPVKFVNGPIWADLWLKVLFGYVKLGYAIRKRPPYASACNLAFKKSKFSGYNTLLTQGGDELDVVRRLKKEGKIIYDSSNFTFSSSRRAVRGFLYNVVITFLIYYILDYNLGRITKRSVFGSYPAYRNEVGPRVLLFAQVCITVVIMFAFLAYTKPGNYIFDQAHKTVQRVPDQVKTIRAR